MTAELFNLLLASLALAVGPAVGSSGSAGPRTSAANDGFTIALVSALCAVLVLPHVISPLGFAGAVLVAAGAAIPILLRRLRVRTRWSVSLILGLIMVHAAIDGAVIGISTGHGSGALPWAIIAHRIPVGFALFAWAVRVSATPLEARRTAWMIAALLVFVTVLGFAGGSTALTLMPAQAPEIIEALVAGALIAIVLTPEPAAQDAGHGATMSAQQESQAHTPELQSRWAGIGAIFGLFVFLGVAAAGGVEFSSPPMAAAAQTFWALVLESAPALLLGFTLAGIVPFLLTGSALATLRRGTRLAQAARGVAYGLPLPVCSCGVLPVYQSLVRRGAPPAAALAFLVATPELGLDAVLLSVPLLGGPLTVARVVAAVVVALLVALFVEASASRTASTPVDTELPDHGEGDLSERIRAGLRFGFVEVFDHTMPWIVLGLLIAALAEPILAEGSLQDIHPFFQVPLAALVSIPLYVCASGATPIAALAIHKGLSAGAALAFLIAGPATNLTTFGILAKLHGRRMALMFGGTVSLLAILAGWTVDFLGVPAEPLALAHGAEEHSVGALGVVCAALLGIMVIGSLLRQGPRGMVGQIVSPIHVH